MKDDLLMRCTPTARWMYERIQPFLETGSPYGYLRHEEIELAAMYGVSQPTVSNALWDLHRAGLMRKARTGTWYCPVMISELLVRVRS